MKLNAGADIRFVRINENQHRISDGESSLRPGLEQ